MGNDDMACNAPPSGSKTPVSPGDGRRSSGSDLDLRRSTSVKAGFFQSNEDKKIQEVYEIDYSPEKALGHGMTGSVVVAKKRGTEFQYAVKTIHKLRIKEDSLKRMRAEIDMLRHLDHPNI